MALSTEVLRGRKINQNNRKCYNIICKELIYKEFIKIKGKNH